MAKHMDFIDRMLNEGEEPSKEQVYKQKINEMILHAVNALQQEKNEYTNFTQEDQLDVYNDVIKAIRGGELDDDKIHAVVKSAVLSHFNEPAIDDVDDDKDEIEEASQPKKKIEAYGVKGMQSKQWRKTFSSEEALQKWAEKNDAEVHGINADDVQIVEGIEESKELYSFITSDNVISGQLEKVTKSLDKLQKKGEFTRQTAQSQIEPLVRMAANVYCKQYGQKDCKITDVWTDDDIKRVSDKLIDEYFGKQTGMNESTDQHVDVRYDGIKKKFKIIHPNGVKQSIDLSESEALQELEGMGADGANDTISKLKNANGTKSAAFVKIKTMNEGSGDTQSVLSKDGKEIFRGTHNKCLEHLHKIQSASWDHALKHEGYKIEQVNEAKAPKHSFKTGDKVKLKDDALQSHVRSVPAHAGYSHEQFEWRDTLRKLKGKTVTFERTFDNSNNVNVDFDGELIGIDVGSIEPINENAALNFLDKRVNEDKESSNGKV